MKRHRIVTVAYQTRDDFRGTIARGWWAGVPHPMAARSENHGSGERLDRVDLARDEKEPERRGLVLKDRARQRALDTHVLDANEARKAQDAVFVRLIRPRARSSATRAGPRSRGRPRRTR